MHRVPTLVGRKNEIDQLSQKLCEPDCRLLTILGPGGSGKTHLATYLLEHLKSAFADGVEIIALQSVTAPERLTTIISEILNIPLSGKRSAEEQLIKALRELDILLVLDNYEHLLPHVDLLTEILIAAPRVTLLVTSREPLQLRDEMLYPIAGLEYPETVEETKRRSYDSIEFFTACATRVKPRFEVKKELEEVVRICRSVQGLPLGIELAASWVQSLTCTEIADEVERNLDFLQTHLRDVPERHRSLRAVFDQTWSALSAEEQTCFRRLAVFTGGFQREAAEKVTGMGWLTLSSLSNKMLLQRRDDGRYLLHELLKQYAHEKLQEAGELEATITAHALYYATFLAERRVPILGGNQHRVSNEITEEFENILSNLSHILSAPAQETVDQIMYPLNDALQFSNRYHDAYRVYKKAIAILGDHPSTILYEVLTMLGWIHVRFGQSSQATACAQKALKMGADHQIAPLPGYGSDAHTLMSIISMIQGADADAFQWGKMALQQAESRQDEPNQAMAHYNLCDAYLARENYNLAYFHIQQAVMLCRRLGDQWFMAYCLNHQGQLMRIQGDYVAARQLYQESYRIREEYNDVEGMAVALMNLGYIGLLQERFEDAYSLLERSYDLYRTINDRGGTVIVLSLLGESTIAFGEFDRSCDYLIQALHLTQEIEAVPRTLAVISQVGLLAFATGMIQFAAFLLHFVAENSLSERDTIIQARLRLKRLRAIISDEDDCTAAEKAATFTLDKAIRECHKIIPLTQLQPSQTWEKAKFKRNEKQNLVEPLSDRELEILRLLVKGLTNHEIAEQLIVAEGTIKAHNYHIFSKLGVRNRLRAATRARELGLVD